MNLLAIDSSFSILSAAVSKNEEIYYGEIQAGMKHSELVMELIDSQMKKAHLSPQELDGVLCMGGPGSFTGLRIGFSIAKGLALSLSIPFASVPTLDCMAFPCLDRAQTPLSPTVLSVMEAGKNTFYYSFYTEGLFKQKAVQNEDAQVSHIETEIERYGQITITGAGAASLYGLLSAKTKKNMKCDFQNKGYAKEIISIAIMRNIMDNDNTAFLYSGPEYIRKTDADL